MEDKKTITVKRERQTIDLLKMIAYEDLSKFIDKYDYLGVMLAYRSYATTILESNGIFNKQHIVTDEEKLKEVEEYMETNKTPEEILNEMCNVMPWQFIGKEQIFPYLKEAFEIYSKQQYNQAIKDAVENAKVKSIKTEIGEKLKGLPISTTMRIRFIVDKDSILKLLKE